MFSLNIIHYNPNETGLRLLQTSENYFNNVFNEQKETIYKPISEINDFLGFLNSRLTYPDVVLITAHGTNNAILRLRKGTLVKAMRLHQTRLFKHNFVFAISCGTATEFGSKAIDEAAQVYIGFDDEIQSDFKFDNGSNNKFNLILESVFKEIYQTSVNEAFEIFIKKCLTAKEFCMHMDLIFKRQVRKTLRMGIKELRTIYSAPITDKYVSELKAIIKLQFLAKFDSLRGKITLLGDEQFVPWYFINRLNEEELEELLTKVKKLKK